MSTETTPVDYGELRHTLGRVEGRVESLAEGQRDLREEQRQSMEETRSGFAEVNRRIDRLFYAILAVGSAFIAALLADRFISAS